MRGGGGRALFLVMQVLEIPAGGRGFPLVSINTGVAIFLIFQLYSRIQVKI